MYDRITNCDVCECAECPRYGDDCDGDKRNDELISRADAIEAVCDVVMDEFNTSATWGYDVAEKALSALPSAEAEEHRIYKDGYNTGKAHASADAVQGWIPCSERLPKRDELVLVTYKTTDRIHLCRYLDDGSENPWWSYIDDCCAWNNVVLAWMPLPKPYKGGDDK